MFSDCLEMEESDMTDVDYRTKHSQRIKQLGMKDPVYSVSIRDYVRDQFMALKSILGNDRYHSLLLAIDEEDLENLRDYFDLGVPVLQYGRN